MIKIKPLFLFSLFFLIVHCVSSHKAQTILDSNHEHTSLSAEVHLSSAEAHEGELEIVTLDLSRDLSQNLFQEPKIVGVFDQKEIPFFSVQKENTKIYMALVGIPYSYKPGPAVLDVKVEIGQQRYVLQASFVVVAGQFPSEELKVDPKKVIPSPEDAKRIQRESAEVGAIYGQITQEKIWAGPFLLPIQSEITSFYGTKRIYNGQMESYHSGIDLRASVGTPIQAAAAGRVAMAKNLFLTGNTIILDHGYGVFSIYAHMSKIKIRKNQKVKAKQLLGLSGQTGRVSGPHLHWTVVVHRVKINPMIATQFMP